MWKWFSITQILLFQQVVINGVILEKLVNFNQLLKRSTEISIGDGTS